MIIQYFRMTGEEYTAGKIAKELFDYYFEERKMKPFIVDLY